MMMHVIIQLKHTIQKQEKRARQARHAGLVPRRLAAAPGVRQARHVGLVPRRLAAAPGVRQACRCWPCAGVGLPPPQG